jgi:hypothetical protein
MRGDPARQGSGVLVLALCIASLGVVLWVASSTSGAQDTYVDTAAAPAHHAGSAGAGPQSAP